MYKIEISVCDNKHGWTSGILTDEGEIVDCPGDLSEEVYKAVGKTAHESKSLTGTVIIDGTKYRWTLTETQTWNVWDEVASSTFSVITDPSGAKLSVIESGGCPVESILRGVDLTLDTDDLREAIRTAWSKGYDGDPDNIKITIS